MVWGEEHSRGLKTHQNYVSHKEEVGGGALSKRQERALSHCVSNVEGKSFAELFPQLEREQTC